MASSLRLSLAASSSHGKCMVSELIIAELAIGGGQRWSGNLEKNSALARI